MAARNGTRPPPWTLGAAIVVSCALCATLQPATTLAQPLAPAASNDQRSEPSAADKETARNLVAIGDQKTEAGEHAAALKAYRGADAIMGVPTTGIEVGRALTALGQLAEARDQLLTVSRFPAAPDEPEPFSLAREEAAELAERLAARIPSMQLELRGLPEGAAAEVRLDGELVKPETWGLPRKLNPGKHGLNVTAAGFQPLEITVDLAEGEARVVEIPLQRTSTPPPPVEEGISPLVYIGFGIAGGGLLIGSITGGVSLSMASDVKDQCTDDVCPTSVETDADRSVTFAHVSTVSFILAGVGAGVGVLGLFWPEIAGSEDEAVAIQPTVGPGFFGLRGRF